MIRKSTISVLSTCVLFSKRYPKKDRARMGSSIVSRSFIYLFSACVGLLTSFSAVGQTTTQVITTPGNGSFNVPAGVTNITVEVWGGGGGGGSSSNTTGDGGGGGGGGAYSIKVFSGSLPASYNYYVGGGGAGSPGGTDTHAEPGEDTWFGANTTLMAKGGSRGRNDSENANGGAGGATGAGAGDTKRKGGDGANGGDTGGAGGGSAGPSSNGNDASGNNATAAVTDGGAGGNGGSTGNPGGAGGAPGGGGGGSNDIASESGGNGAPGQIRISYTRPTIAISAPSATEARNSSSITYTITYTGANAVTLANGDITLNTTGGASATVNVTGSGTSTRTVTLTNFTGDGTVGISVAAGTATNSSGNAATSAGPSATINVDNTPPGIAISAPSATDANNSSSVTYTITYTGANAVTLANGDITLNATGGASATVNVSGSGTSTRTVTLTNFTGNGTVGISVAASTATDVAGNAALAAGPSATINVDNVPPGIAISAPSAATTNSTGTVTYTITYTGANAVTLADGDITLNTTGGASASFAVSGSGTTTRTVTLTGFTGDGTVGISVAAGTATDVATNAALAAGPSATITVEAAPPGIAISAPSATNANNSSSITYTITYTDANAVTLANGDITLNTTGGASATVAVSGSGTTTRTVTLTNFTGDGTVSISLAAGTATDVATNAALAAGPSATIDVDNTPPGIAISAPSATDANNSSSITYTITYTGANAVTLANGDITLNTTGGASASVAVSGSGTTTRTVTLTSFTGNGTVGISLAAGTATDALANAALVAGPSSTINVDNTPPGIAISAPSAASANGASTITYTITYTGANAVTLANGDITLNTTGGASASVAVTGSGTTTRTVTLTSFTGDGTVDISLAAGTAADAAGNTALAAGPSAAITVDAVPPGIAISAPSAADANNSSSVTYIITYTDANAVTLADPNVTLNTTGGASASIAVSGSGTATRTVTLSNFTGNGTVGISIAAGTATDAAGNAALAAGPSTVINVDNVAPSISIGAPSATDAKNSSSVTYTITYTGADAVTLSAADISLNTTGGASASVAVSGTGTTTRTVTLSSFTGDGTVGISIAAGTATDVAGNTASTAGPSTTINVDNTAPVMSIGAPSASIARNASTVTYTITYTGANAVTLTSGNISLNSTGGASASIAVSGSGTSTRTVTLTNFTGNGTVGIFIAGGTGSDAAGNTTSGSASGNITVDNTPPTVSIGAPSATIANNAASVTYTITYGGADAVTLAAGNISLVTSGGASASVAVSGTGTTTRTVTLTNFTGNGTVRISIAAGTASDIAGNTAAGAGPSSPITVDNTPPGISISAPSASVANSGTGSITYTITYTGANAVSLANGHITLNTTGGASASVVVSGSGVTTRTVTLSGFTGDGTVGISIAASTATDAAGNTALSAGPSATIEVDNIAPNITGITINSTTNGSVTNGIVPIAPGNYVDFKVDFDDNVVVAPSDFEVQSTGSIAALTAADISTTPGAGNSWIIRVNNITGTGLLKINFNDADASVVDNAGNPIAGGSFFPAFSGLQYYSIVLPEPVAPVANFIVSSLNEYSLNLLITHSVVPGQAATHYLVMARESLGAAPFPTITDGNFHPNDINDGTWGQFNGNGVFILNATKNIAATQTAHFEPLKTGMSYDFIVYPYTLGNYSNDNINYGTPTTILNHFNPVSSSSTLASTPVSAAIPSTVTASPGQNVFTFTINEEWGNTAGEISPTKFEGLTIRELGGTDNVADWSAIIAGAELYDIASPGTFVAATPSNIQANQIIFTNIPSTNNGDLGYVPARNGFIGSSPSNKTYGLRIYFKNTSGALTGLDNSILAFTINDGDFDYYDGAGTPSDHQASTHFSPGTTASSGSNTIDIRASKLAFDVQPQANIGVGVNFSLSSQAEPHVRALDANNNLDTDYNASFNVSTSIGVFNGHTSFSGGELTLSTFRLTTAGSTTITITGNATGAPFNYPALTGVGIEAVSSSVTAVISNKTTISDATAPASEQTEFSSLTTAVPVNFNFDFTVTDDVGVDATDHTDDDALPTRITRITINQGSGIDPVFTDWRLAIAGAQLTDGSSSQTITSTASSLGVITATTLQFDISTLSTLRTVADNGTKTYQLRIWLKNPVDPAIADLIDKKDFVFSVTETDFNIAAANTTSLLQAGNTNSGDGNNKVDVDATKLAFTTQWAANDVQSYDAALSPSPIAKAQDANGNLDLDYGTAATVQTTAPATYPLANSAVTVNAGILTFNAGLQVTSAGGGLNGDITNLIVSSGTLLNGSSNPFKLTYSTGSDILKDATFNYPTNIPHATANNRIGDITGSTGVEVERYIIRDGGGTADSDGSPTKLGSIKLKVTNYQYLKKIALYNDDTGDEVKELDVQANASVISPGVAEINFTGIATSGTGSFQAPDHSNPANASNKLIVKVSFNNANVIDNAVISFEVVEIASSGVSSGFANPSPAIVSTETGNENKIEITASQLQFINAPAAASINTQLTSPLQVEAVDAFFNRDLDFEGTSSRITVFDAIMIGPDKVTMINKPQINNASHEFTDGVYIFPANFQYTSEITGSVIEGTLEMTAGSSPISGTSPNIDVISSFESTLDFDPGFTYTSNIPYFNRQDNANMEPIAGYILADGGGSNDVDGAPTSIESITFAITTNGNPGSSDIRNLALFNSSGTLLASQPLSGGSITFSGITGITTVTDNASAVFTLRASFKDTPADVHDHDQIQVSITNVKMNGGSQLNPIGGVTGVNINSGTGAVTAAPFTPSTGVNVVNVVATRIDFTTQPNAFEGIQQPLGINPVVRARDANSIVDLDHNFAASLSSTATLSNNSFVFVNGEVILSGLHYTSTGNGTITITSNGLSSNAGGSIACSHVDVINTASTLATVGVVSSPNLPGGAVNRVIFGATITAPYTAGGEPKLDKFIISFSNPITNVLKNFRVFESTNNTAYDGTDADVVTDATIGAVLTIGTNSIIVDFPGAGPRNLASPLTYFLMVDVEPTASGSTPKIQPIVYNDASHIFVTQGSVYAPIVPPATSSATFGKEYSFASIFPPTLTSSYPASGQLNVDPNQPTIDLVFSVPVWSLDREILLYDKTTGTSVTLPALNGDHTGGSATLAGTIANPLRFDLPSMLPDHVYYVTIAPGKKPTTIDPVGDGIVDESLNEFPGFSYSGTLYFKTANPNPPQLLAASITNASSYGAVLNATFDQRGKAYFMVVPHNAAAPNNAEIKGTALTYLGTVLDRGSFDITQTMTASQFGLINANLSLSTQYDVWMYAENDALPTPVSTTDPYGSDFIAGHAGPTLVFATASSNPPTGPVVPTISFCKDSYQPLSAPIMIVENNPGDFSSTGDQIFNLLLPTGFQFDISLNSSNEPIYGTLMLSGSDFIGSGSLKFINNSTLQVKFKNSGSTSRDQIAIAGLRVLATTATSGDIIRLGGNALTSEMPDLTVLAKLTSYDASSLIISTNFTNLYTRQAYNNNLVTTIPDNYNSPTFNVELLPLLDPGDYGPSSFAGAGVNVNQLNLSAVTKNTPFNITHTHTDNNGCLSKISVQYTVYDHTSAIRGLSLKFCAKNPSFPNSAPVNHPSLLQEVKFDNLAAHQMYNLKADVPFDAEPLTTGTSKSQIIFGTGWKTILQGTATVEGLAVVTATFPDPNDPLRTYKNYKIDAAKILNVNALSGGTVPDPYSYFDEITPQKNTYYTGGSLGFVEFTGEYQNVANASVQVPLKQNVQFFLPAIPVVELSKHSFLDVLDPNNPIDSDRPSNKGTPVFCREGGLVNINAYPAAAVGSSIGMFKLYDINGNDITPSDGFTDNGNGTAILDPTKFWNDYNDIKIVYTYKENESPCEGSGYQIIRIAPNPVAQFTALSSITPNTPVGTAYCKDVAINFNAETSSISNGTIVHYKWDFTDEGSSGNDVEGDKATAEKHTRQFATSLEYNPELVVTSNYGCQSDPFSLPLKVGAIPSVAFSFEGVSTADKITFTNHSTIGSHATLNDDYARLDWNYGHGSPENTVDDAKVMNHQYTVAGKFNANLKVTSVLGCVNEATKPIVIVPQVNLNDNVDAYFADFQSNGQGYQDVAATGASSWQYGIPAAGTVIGDATDDSNGIWTTSLSGTYNPNERSALYTAAFDVYDLVRPIITFNSFRNLGQGDGVVLEYSIDNYNIADDTRKEWIRLGEIKSTTLTSTGVNWYNGLSLPSKPGEQKSGDNGWTGADLEWKPSKHSLAEIPKAARHRVVFRFALASVSSNPSGDGFAIDDVRVGNGTRTVLIENFTNTASTDAAVKIVSDTLKNFQKANEVGLEVIKLNYHVAFPGEDPFNVHNPLDPGARALYYGVATVPQTRLDGTFSTTPGPLFSQWGRPEFDSRILDLANAEITVDADIVDDALTIKGTFKPLINLTRPTILHVAVVEKHISLNNNPELNAGRIRSGETEFEYVLRKMLPNGAGTKYSTPITNGQTVEFGPFTWSNATLFKPQDDVQVIVFLQDEDSKVIYQSYITPTVNDPGIVTGIDDYNTSFNVYPNPADREMTVELPETATQRTTLRMYDQLGKVVEESYFERGDSKKTIGTESFAGGVYVIQIETPKGMLRRKVMVTHRN